MVEPAPTTVLKYADETGDYRSKLIVYLDELTILYEALISKMMHGTYDDEIVNLTISKMVTITSHLLPKLEGGGDKTKRLLGEFDEFMPWLEQVCMPKAEPSEAEKIPKLFMLILRAYHLLNISNY